MRETSNWKMGAQARATGESWWPFLFEIFRRDTVVEIPQNAGTIRGKVAIPRLRKAIRVANRFAPLGVTVLLLAIAVPVFATTYYVSSSMGSDSNNGTSSSSAWQTIAHVNAQTFQPGDSILFKRGDVWNESLATPSSGTAGNPITFDAYGTGAAPNLTGYYAVPASAWVHVSGNAWKGPLPSTYSTINFCMFGSVWGEKVAASTTNLTSQWNFYFANGYVYVYATENPSLLYNEPIVPMALSNVPVINTNGQSWLTFQHFLVNWFDQYGVYVQGASDHLVFANMESDSMIPQGMARASIFIFRKRRSLSRSRRSLMKNISVLGWIRRYGWSMIHRPQCP